MFFLFFSLYAELKKDKRFKEAPKAETTPVETKKDK